MDRARMIILYPDNRLKTACHTVKEYDDKLINQFKILNEAAGEECIENGILGIAANQVGFDRRFFLFWDLEFSRNEIAINPFVWDELGPFKVKVESCLSMPGKYFSITRPSKIEVSYVSYTKGFEQVTRTFEGLAAQIFCHEFDHINGKLISDNGNREPIPSVL
jgi:peptide deformylase